MLDAIRSDENGYFDTHDVFTAIPRALASREPYAGYTSTPSSVKATDKPLKGMRIGIVREYMVKHTPNDGAISDRVDEEIKKVLRDRLGAEIVESVDPMYPDDPAVPNMKYTFQDALAEIIPFVAPEYLLQKEGDAFEFAVPGYDVQSQDYMIKLALRQAPLSDKLNMRRILSGLEDGDRTSFMMSKYLLDRGDARVKDLASYAANSKWRANTQAIGTINAANKLAREPDVAIPQGVDRVKMQSALRMAVLKVMHENKIDVFVHPNVGVPQWKIGFDREPTINGRLAAGPSITDLLGVVEITVPAGFNQIVFESYYELSADKKRYTLMTGRTQSLMKHPMPFSINFWAGPGDEPTVLKVASIYESSTQHRIAPAAFGPVSARKQ